MYLEEAMMTQKEVAINKPVKWLTTDFNQLKILHDDSTKIYNVQIKELFAKAKLVEIFQLSSSLP